MTHVLVTGAAGYIGSILVPRLLEAGYRVTCVDSFIYRQTSLLDCCRYKTLTIVRGDVRNETLMRSLMKDVDYIIPLACLTGAPLCSLDPVGAKTINFDAVKFIVDNRSTAQRIIFPTTNSGYGIGQEGIFCTEETPLHPVSLYGRLKADIEKVILDAGNSVTFRLATVFGASPRMRMDLLVNDFVYRALYDRAVVLFEAHFKRNYLHVQDAARAFLFTIEHFDAMKGQTYNVGLNEANLSKFELCEAIKKRLPDFVFLESAIGEDPDKRNYIVSNDKINKCGFHAQTTIDDGILELINAFRVVKNNAHGNI